MKILRMCRFCWRFISGIYVPQNSSSNSMILLSYLLNFLICFGLFVIIFGSIEKMYYEDHDVEQISFIFLQFSINISMLITNLFYITNKSSLIKIIEKFQKLVNARYNEFTSKIYEKAEQRTESVTKWPFIVLSILFDGLFSIVICILLIVTWKNGVVDVRKWPNALLLRFR